uniref:Uncharacterized protein n=1 Tax=Arundo donax TaxID=35708 RepID=A0A0A9TZT9_ARUDO
MVPTGGTGWTTPLPERCLHPTSQRLSAAFHCDLDLGKLLFPRPPPSLVGQILVHLLVSGLRYLLPLRLLLHCGSHRVPVSLSAKPPLPQHCLHLTSQHLSAASPLRSRRAPVPPAAPFSRRPDPCASPRLRPSLPPPPPPPLPLRSSLPTRVFIDERHLAMACMPASLQLGVAQCLGNLMVADCTMCLALALTLALCSCSYARPLPS